MAEAEFRAAVLRQHGAREDDLDELLAYTENSFEVSAEHFERTEPLPDEASLAAWRDYANEAQREGAFTVLRDRLVQLRFPVAAGTRRDPAYLAATRRGAAPPEQAGLALEEPESLQLTIHPTPAGAIPVVLAPNRRDFESLLQALTRRNEPEPIPAAVGATIISGYNNWDRIRRLESDWSASNPFGDWPSAWRRLQSQKELYQDRFILLSDGPYSGVPAADFGLSDEAWRRKSLTLRLEHECAHYFTRRMFGVMRNSLHDEIIADFAGITATESGFRADWFLHFLGLEDYPQFRPGGRLTTYRGDPPLSDAAFRVLQSLVRSAAMHLEAVTDSVEAEEDRLDCRARRLCALASVTIEEMASDQGREILARAFAGRR